MASNKGNKHHSHNSSQNSHPVSKPPRNVSINIPQPFTVRQESTNEGSQQYAEERSNRETQLRTAQRLNWITVIGIVIAFFSLVAVYIGIYQSRQAFERGQRAWVGLDIDPRGHPIILGDSGKPDRFAVFFKNFGQSPAFHFRLYAELDASEEMPDWPLVEQKIENIVLRKGLNSVSIFTGQTSAFAGVGPTESDAFRANIRTAYASQSLILIGKAVYEDEFFQTHETTFCIRYAPVSAETWESTEGWQTCPIGNHAT